MIGIIGGTGVYKAIGIEIKEEVEVSTEFGKPSDSISIGTLHNKEVAFLPRHGKNHQFPPHKVNYRANIRALKEIGVTELVTVSAVGSLKEDIKPGHFAVLRQYVDLTKSRKRTFFDNRTVHVSMAEPVCSRLSDLLFEKAKPDVHNATYVCIEGPQFSTKAESYFYRGFADVIGMTANPEVQLAREAEMCYASLLIVTDYDCWRDSVVNAEEVLKRMADSLKKAGSIISEFIRDVEVGKDCECKHALDNAVV